MSTFTKSTLLTILGTFLITTASYCQFTIEAGNSIPIGDFAATDVAAAKPGISVRGGWDKLFTDNIGIANGIFLETHGLRSEADGLEGKWKRIGLETGLWYKASERINIKGMVIGTLLSSPVIEITNSQSTSTFTVNSGTLVLLKEVALGLDLRVEYVLDQFFLSISYKISQFEQSTIDSEVVPLPSSFGISTLGLNFGYQF